MVSKTSPPRGMFHDGHSPEYGEGTKRRVLPQRGPFRSSHSITDVAANLRRHSPQDYNPMVGDVVSLGTESQQILILERIERIREFMERGLAALLRRRCDKSEIARLKDCLWEHDLSFQPVASQDWVDIILEDAAKQEATGIWFGEPKKIQYRIKDSTRWPEYFPYYEIEGYSEVIKLLKLMLLRSEGRIFFQSAHYTDITETNPSDTVIFKLLVEPQATDSTETSD